MELFLWTGTIISIAGHHIIWTAEPSAEQLENEKYWETQTKPVSYTHLTLPTKA